MAPAEAFRWLLSSLAPIMKRHGFRKYRNSFQMDAKDNIGVIDIQKSRRTTAEMVLFTISLGVFSRRLSHFSFRPRDAKSVAIEDCHYILRAGHLLEPSGDKWWSISSDINMEDLLAEITGIICERVIPEILSNISDEALRDRALSGSLPGATDMMMLEYLVILLSDLGPINQLPEVLSQLRSVAKDSRQMAIIESHIEDLQRRR